ncbi:MAG: hypothetical protein HRT37_25805 [Alteromonadaceae bacterium]|nr:hypothetical protein [Alteromonadaceae bacterium]
MSEQPIYNTETPYPYMDKPYGIDKEVFLKMVDLFIQINRFWKLKIKELQLSAGEIPQKSLREIVSENSMGYRLWTFMNNRITFDLSYLADYQNASAVIEELIANNKGNENEAYEFLFTDTTANISPPATRLSRARQKVSNEFVSLALILGGFEAYGAKNYIGYFGGSNIKGKTPYRSIPSTDDDNNKTQG